MTRLQSQPSLGLDCFAEPTRDRARYNPTRGFPSPFGLGSARTARRVNGCVAIQAKEAQ